MNKYFCNVNNKFLCIIESVSALSAERFFLNGFESVYACTAFDQSQLSTDTFAGWLNHLETISVSELRMIDDEFTASMNNMQNAMQAKIDILAQIEELQNALAEVEDGLKNALNHNAECQLKTGYNKKPY